MIALIKKFVLGKIASLIGSGNTKQIEQLIPEKKKASGKKKSSTKPLKSSLSE